jgi:oxazoline/thiazoline synthase
MIDRPVFKPTFHVEVVNPEGVYLLSERAAYVLRGELYCRLAPLLDGRHTADNLVDALADVASPAEVYYTLARLEQKGYVIAADGVLSPARAAFWDALGLDTAQVETRLHESTVTVTRFGAVAVEPLAAALEALGVRVGEPGDFTVVLVDDYLQAGLAELNAAALASERSWLLVKPVGTVLWLGPVFRPGQTGCWQCLAQRLQANREVEDYLRHRKQLEGPLPVARGAVSAGVRLALEWAALETARALVGGAEQPLAGAVLTVDLPTLETQWHTLVRRPQCPSCGEMADRARQPAPPTLRSQRKQFTTDGGHRTVSPEQTLARYGHHVSPISGAVSVLARMPVSKVELLHVYLAGHHYPIKADSLFFLRRGLRNKSAGKGISDAQARASGLCEALERHSGNFQGDEIRKQASYRRLGASAIHPNACMLFSEKQYESRKRWNAQFTMHQHVPDPFDEGAEIEWTPVWSLTEQEFKYLPTAYCYYGYPKPPATLYCSADSNGNAAGNTLEEAILQGFLELVERDSVCLWWYNRVQRPAVELDSVDEPYIQDLRVHYSQLNRDLWVLDLTSDLRIPVFVAVSRRTDKAQESIMFGFGAHLDARIGILRALTELNQLLALRENPDAHKSFEYASEDREDLEYKHWIETATVANQPYLVPDDTLLPLKFSAYDLGWSEDVREDVLRCQEIVERQGMEMLVLDQTRPDIGMPVAKVFVPGLRHFWARLGPGRLYDVPVKLGWFEEPLDEDQLNPIPMFT